MTDLASGLAWRTDEGLESPLTFTLTVVLPGRQRSSRIARCRLLAEPTRPSARPLHPIDSEAKAGTAWELHPIMLGHSAAHRASMKCFGIKKSLAVPVPV